MLTARPVQTTFCTTRHTDTPQVCCLHTGCCPRRAEGAHKSLLGLRKGVAASSELQSTLQLRLPSRSCLTTRLHCSMS